MLFLLLACEPEDPTEPELDPVETPPDVPSGGQEGEDEVEAPDVAALHALGYVDVAEEGDDDRVGVVHNDARARDGVRLYSLRRPCVAVLVDLEGEELQRWSVDDCGHLATASLLPDGDLLVVAERPGPKGKSHPAQRARVDRRYLARYAPDGTERWRADNAAHHWVAMDSDGTLLTLTSSFGPDPLVHPTASVRDDHVARIDPDSGAVLQEQSLIRGLRGTDFPFVAMAQRRRIRAIDFVHANTVQPLDDGVLVTIRRQNTVARLNHDGEVTWFWGPDDISGPHGGTVLPDDNVLIFDNGLGRGVSRVIEVDPTSDAIVWSYTAPDFYTASRGYAQRLEGGTTLITSSGQGHVFEVTPDGERVWEFYAPMVAGGRGSINQMIHYEGG